VNELVTFQTTFNLIKYEIYLIAFFIIFAFLRALKFFTIPPYSGPSTQAILETLRDRALIIFVLIFMYILFSFALAFYVALGVDDFEMRQFGTTVSTIVRMILGDFDYDSFYDGNRYLGPILFMAFMLFCGIILMNLFIAVISDIYINKEKQNEQVYEIYITKLLMEVIAKHGKIITFRIIRNFWRWIKKQILIRRGLLPSNPRVQSVVYNSFAPEDFIVSEVPLDNCTDEVEEFWGDNKEQFVQYDENSLDDLSIELENKRKEKSNLEIHTKIMKLEKNLNADMQKINTTFNNELKELKILLQASMK